MNNGTAQMNVYTSDDPDHISLRVSLLYPSTNNGIAKQYVMPPLYSSKTPYHRPLIKIPPVFLSMNNGIVRQYVMPTLYPSKNPYRTPFIKIPPIFLSMNNDIARQ